MEIRGVHFSPDYEDPVLPRVKFNELTGQQSNEGGGVPMVWTGYDDLGPVAGPRTIFKVADTSIAGWAGTGNNGTTTPGDRPCPRASYNTYRWMMCDPTVALAYALVVAPIVACEWAYETVRPSDAPKKEADAEDDAIDEELARRREFIRLNLAPRKASLMAQMCKSIMFGHRGFEQVFQPFEFESEQYIGIKKFKPLRPDITNIEVIEDTGAFDGFKQGDVRLKVEYTLLYTYNIEDDNWEGRSRFENIRENAWWPWMCLRHNAARLDRKVSNIVPVVKGPMSQVDTVNGQEITGWQVGQAIINALTSGNGVMMENLIAAVDDLAHAPELAKASKWVIESFDIGQVANALGGQNERLRYYDSLKFRGMLRPERSGLESSIAGSRADSESQGDSSITEGEELHTSIVQCINWHCVDRLLAWNFGEDARGSVYIKPTPLSPDKKALYRRLVDSMISNSSIINQIVTRLDLQSIFDGAGVPIKQNQEVQISKQEMDALEQQKQEFEMAKIQEQARGRGNAEGQGQNPTKKSNTDN